MSAEALTAQNPPNSLVVTFFERTPMTTWEKTQVLVTPRRFKKTGR